MTFAVDDADAIAAKVADLGGEIVLAPRDAPWVRTTVVTDPQGPTFTASKFVPENRDLADPSGSTVGVAQRPDILRAARRARLVSRGAASGKPPATRTGCPSAADLNSKKGRDMPDDPVTPLTSTRSPHTVRETADRAEAAIRRRAITVFARVDHGAGARSAGLELPDEELLVFGDPKAGTLLMQTDPTFGYELPLRLLVWDAAGQTMIGYRAPAAMAAGYALPPDAPVLERMRELLDALVAESTAAAQ